MKEIVFCLMSSICLGDTIFHGISNKDLALKPGSTISEVQVKLISDSPIDIYMLDNVNPGIEKRVISLDETFSFGAYLGKSVAGITNISLRNLNDPTSDVWNFFPSPLTIRLSNGESFNYSSTLLKILNYVGTGRSIGFVFVECEEVPKLRISFKIESYLGEYTKRYIYIYQGDWIDLAETELGMPFILALADNWLSNTVVGWPDLTGDGKVNFQDFALYAKNRQ